MSLKNRAPHSKHILRLLIIPLYVLLSSACAYCQSGSEPIIVNGDNVEYYQEKKQVVGTGNVSIAYKDVILTCDRITVDLATRDAEASGNVRIRQKDAYFTGDSIKYNFDTKKGEVLNGYINAAPFYGRAKQLGKPANKDEFIMNTGYVTTCDLDHPHYRIEARQVKIYPEEKVVAKNVRLYAGNIPIFWIPYWVQPLGRERKTHITITPGNSKDWGYYGLLAYRYYLTDHSRGDLLLDYRSKKGLAVGVNHYIDTREVGRGAFKVYYTQENNNLAFEKTGAVRDRYRFQYRHRWDMPDVDTSAIIEFNKLSDANVIKDYFYNEYEELGSTPDNYISFITAKKDYTSEFLVRFAPNPFYPVVERLPEYKFDILNYKIGKTNFYYSGNTSASVLNLTYDKAFPKRKNVNVIRANTYNELSYSARLFKALSLRPYVAMGNTYYSRNKWGDTNQIRTYFQEGADASIKFYKIYDFNTDFLGLNINRLRHIITPTAGYYNITTPTISANNLTRYDEIDAVAAANGVTLGLENRLQTKRKVGDQMRSVDLATLMINTDYQFRLNKDFWGVKSDRFNNLFFKLELIPYSWLYITSDMMINTKLCSAETANVDFVANGGKRWALSAGLRYQDSATMLSNQITMSGRFKINDAWSVRIYERFDTETKKWSQQEYVITRDLHCWIAEITIAQGDSTGNPANTSLWFIMKLKAFPDYPIGMRQTYSRPRFGEAGARQ